MKSIIISVLLLGLAAGCGHATSEHPLSDESDSILDKRLIGWWATSSNSEKRESSDRVAIGRLADKDLLLKTALELVYTKFEDNGIVKVVRQPFYTTKFGDKYYASVPLVGKQGYMIFRYDVQGDKLIIDYMDMEELAVLIDSKQVAGTVTREKQTLGSSPKLINVHLSLSKEKLRAWIPTAPAKIWARMDKTLDKVVLRRE